MGRTVSCQSRPARDAGLVVQLPADLLADLLPLVGFGLDPLRLDDLTYDFQVVRGADAAGGAGAPRRRPRRRLLFGSFLSAFNQTTQEQLELGAVQVLALGTKEPAGQGIELLTQDLVLFEQQSHLIA